MSWKRWTFITAGIAIALAFTWLVWSELAKRQAPQLEGNIKSTTSPTPSGLVAKPAEPSAIPLSEVEIRGKKEQQMSALFQMPIAVYGKVSDEAGRPVIGATVEIGVNDRPFKTGSKYTVITDANGRFSLTGVHGLAFSVAAAKAGYYSTKESRGHRNVVSPTNDALPSPSEDKPIVLVLRKKGEAEPLNFASSRQIDLPATGKSVSFSLSTGQTGRGQLEIRSFIGDLTQARFDWRYELSVPNGGLVAREDQFSFVAPADGYQETVVIEMARNAENWVSRVEREYFAKLPDGSFGRFSIRFYPGKRNFVVLESYVNPAKGSRNLEYDPAKQASAN